MDADDDEMVMSHSPGHSRVSLHIWLRRFLMGLSGVVADGELVYTEQNDEAGHVTVGIRLCGDPVLLEHSAIMTMAMNVMPAIEAESGSPDGDDLFDESWSPVGDACVRVTCWRSKPSQAIEAESGSPVGDACVDGKPEVAEPQQPPPPAKPAISQSLLELLRTEDLSEPVSGDDVIDLKMQQPENFTEEMERERRDFVRAWQAARVALGVSQAHSSSSSGAEE